MSSSDPLAFEVGVAEFIQMKEQMAEMMCMMQQLVIEGNQDSSCPTLKDSAPHFENETRPPPNPN